MKPIWLMQPIPYLGEKLKGNWIWEPKIDGWRMQIIIHKTGKIEFWGRRLEKNPNWTEKLSYLIKIANNIFPKETLLDCELYSSGGRRLLPSLFAKNPKVKPIIYLFDVIYLEGEFIANLTLEKRKNILDKIKVCPPFYILKYFPLKNLEKALTWSLKKGNEGIVIKKLSSRYEIGNDAPIATQFWRKIK